jgi:hypothetical protein
MHGWSITRLHCVGWPIIHTAGVILLLSSKNTLHNFGLYNVLCNCNFEIIDKTDLEIELGKYN